MARTFNTTGPCNPDWHYMVEPLARLPEAKELVEEGQYFVIHAPRQTGKTTLLRALARQITGEGEIVAVYVSAETGEPAGEDLALAQAAVLSQLRQEARFQLPPELQPPAWPAGGPVEALGLALEAWSADCPRRLAVFIDEIDALRGESLKVVLRQLRAGFARRPGVFPWSVVLCGLRDVREYKAASGGDPERLGTSSPFNIKVKSLRLGLFSRADLEGLMDQHTADTGQVFTGAARERLWELTLGQPWLTNALAREIVRYLVFPPDAPIGLDHAEEAKERLILERQTHLDSLVARLREPRVKRIIEPLISGEGAPEEASYDDDVLYLRDLGLVAPSTPLRVANPIYREVIVRVLSASA